MSNMNELCEMGYQRKGSVDERQLESDFSH